MAMKIDLEGGILDIDDTFSDTQPKSKEGGLHGRSRLAAIYAVGEKCNVPQLLSITPEQNAASFRQARVHTLDGAVWEILRMAGLVYSDEIDPSNELLRLIVILKDTLHEDILRKYGREVPGASHFVRTLAKKLPEPRLAIASMGIRRDILIFLEKVNAKNYFPDNRIISVEDVSRPKPDSQVYEMAFATLDLPDWARSKVLAVEDDQRGIEAANGAGLLTCAITTRFSGDYFEQQSPKSNIIVDSFKELEEVLW